ncbi:4126_t:CDS:2, partial [Funneliformis mosseae]
LLRELFTFGLFMLPIEFSSFMCYGLSYSIAVANFCFKETLAIFLLWRLRQIEHRNSDKWISLVLLFIRTIAQLTQMALSRPEVIVDNGPSACNPNPNSAKVSVWAVNACDFFIEIYVTVRLIQILKRANRNAAQISSSMDRKTKRTLFTAVMYWNFLRLAIAFVISVFASAYTEFISNLSTTHIAIDGAISGIFIIIMSYVITVDAEIVRVIEGKSKKRSNKSSSEKSVPGMPYVPKTYQTKSSHILPKYTSSEQEGNNDDIIVSMKRLSFFEWANLVLGFRRDNEKNFNEEDVVEIIDGPSDFESVNKKNDKR